jgi:acetyl esterase
MSVTIDPSYYELLLQIAEEGVPPRHSLSVAGSRQFLEDAFEDPRAGETSRDLVVPGPNGEIPVRIYEPERDRPLPVLVYFHGGGWVRGDLDIVDASCRTLTERTECMVLSVDYRRAPENPFPAAVEDAYTAVEWATHYLDAFGADTDRIAVGGISSGGNLAAVVSLMAREDPDVSLAYQLLLNPVTDHSFDTESYQQFDREFWSQHCPDGAEGYPLSREDMQWYWEHYLECDIDGKHPYASPLQTRDTSGVPPATVATCEFDPLLDEGRAYAERLRDAGVPVTYREYENVFHSFLSNFCELERADEELDRLAMDVREVLY